jgi:hypothetical protein
MTAAPRTLDLGLWTSGFGPWALDLGLCTFLLGLLATSAATAWAMARAESHRGGTRTRGEALGQLAGSPRPFFRPRR